MSDEAKTPFDEAVEAGAPAHSIEEMIEQLPAQIPAGRVDEMLGLVLDTISGTSKLAQELYLKQLKLKTKLPLGTLRVALKSRQGCTKFRGEIEQMDDGYKDVEDQRMISTFVLEPLRRVTLDDGVEMVEVRITNPTQKTNDTIVLSPAELQSRAALFRRLQTLKHQFTGSDENLQAIAKHIGDSDIPSIRGTSLVGYCDLNGDSRWVAPNTVISSRGVNLETDNDVLCVDPHRSLATRLEYPVVSRGEILKLAREALPLLVNLNAPSVILLMLAWYVAAAFKAQLKRLLGHFPILGVAGTKGAGKTNLSQQVGRLFGMINLEPFSISGTRFTLIRLLASTTSVPVFLDEYKPADLEPRQIALIHRLLRQVYGGEVEERGQADLSVTQYKLSAPVVIAGEAEISDDPALRERVVLVRPDKQELESHPEWQKAFSDLSSMNLEWLAVPFIQFSLAQDVEAELKQARAQLAQGGRKVNDLPLRHQDNLLVLVFGLRMLDAFARSVGVSLTLDAAAMIETYLSQTLDGVHGVKDAFDDFLAECATHARASDLVDGTHYAFVNGKLCIHLASCHQVYLERRSRTGRKDATNGVPALNRIIKEKIKRGGGYVLRADHRVRLGSTTPRTVEIDMALIPDELGIDEFPKNNDRRHGGPRDQTTASEAQPSPLMRAHGASALGLIPDMEPSFDDPPS